MQNPLSSYLLIAAFVLFTSAPAAAIDGEILITQQRAIDGTVPGTDGPGFPITISQPGSYKFGSDIVVNKAGANGIVVNADDVTINFNGFRLGGSNLGNVAIIGARESLTIEDGMIALFKNDAIRGSGPFWRLENMRIVFNAGNGVVGNGNTRHWIIANSEIVENGKDGINLVGNNSAFGPSLIQNNLVNGNKGSGIAATYAHVEGNMIAGNGWGGGDGGVYLLKGMALANTISDNFGTGLSAAVAVGYANNTLSGNTNGQVLGGNQVHPNLCNGTPC